MTNKPLIGITMGDPAGIGPELCLRALAEPRVRGCCVPVVFGDVTVLDRVAERCRLPVPQGTDNARVIDCGAIDGATVRPGAVNEDCGRAAGLYIEAAVSAAMTGTVAAIATAPIHKEALHLAGIPYPGHTEMLAALTGAERVCMMLASAEITVSLVTVHVAHKDVLPGLTVERIMAVIELTAGAMSRLRKTSPVIAVCALNPHAGEHGLFGSEESDLLEPAITAMRAKGICVEGPLPPDTAFLPANRKRIDAYVVMYHDQGLIPFKMLAFDTGVNITLGLPIIRTSATMNSIRRPARFGSAQCSHPIHRQQ